MKYKNASVSFATMPDNDQMCHEFSHSFTDFSSSYIVGYKCDSVGLFIAIVVAAVALVVGQNVLATKEGQASRLALTTRKGSKERGKLFGRCCGTLFYRPCLAPCTCSLWWAQT